MKYGPEPFYLEVLVKGRRMPIGKRRIVKVDPQAEARSGGLYMISLRGEQYPRLRRFFTDESGTVSIALRDTPHLRKVVPLTTIQILLPVVEEYESKDGTRL